MRHFINRSVLFLIGIICVGGVALAGEPAKNSDNQILGHTTQQEYLDELREKQTEKSTMWYKVFGVAACVGILSVGGLMIYLRFKSDEQ